MVYTKVLEFSSPEICFIRAPIVIRAHPPAFEELFSLRAATDNQILN
jgi:hypothetical protein